MKTQWFRWFAFGLLCCVLIWGAPVLAVPLMPSSFWGAVQQGDANVPDNTLVTAWINGVQYAQTQTFTYDGQSVYVLDVPGDDPDTQPIEGGVAGALITFKVSGQPVTATGTWNEGSNVNLDLNVTTADTQPPTGSILINNNATYTNNTAVTLNLTANDNVGVAQMRLSSDGNSWSAWTSYVTTYNNWMLIGMGGTKTAYVQFRDAAGNISATFSDNIILDITAPASAVNALPATQATTSFTVGWSGNDALSGVQCYDVQWRNGMSGLWQNWQSCVTGASTTFNGTAGNTYCFRSRARDRAANWEAYPSNPDYDTCTEIATTNTITIRVDPAQYTTNVGVIFEVALQVQAGTNSLDVVDALLTYDHTLLRVVDADGVDSNTITPGNILSAVLQNTVNNATGQITFSAGRPVGSAPASGTFTLATIRFKAVAPTSSTNIDFTANTRAYYQGNALELTLQPGLVTIQNLVALYGRVQLEGRGASPSNRWQIPVSVSFYTPGATSPITTRNVTLDTRGYFTATGIAPATYDVRVKNSQTLSAKVTGVVVGNDTPIDFGLLREGDVNNDNQVAINDYSLLVTAYGACTGQPKWDARADLNGTGCVDGGDFSLLITNYGLVGAQAKFSWHTGLFSRSGGAVTIKFTPSVSVPDAQGVAVMDIIADAGISALDAVAIVAWVDPQKAQIVGIDGNATEQIEPESTLPIILRNSVDNQNGRIMFDAGRAPGSEPVTGEFVLARVRLRLLQPATNASITFDPLTDVFLAGESVLDHTQNGQVVSGYKVYLPFVMRPTD